MIVWRLCRSVYADLSGKGGLRGQGRWNKLGHPIVYASATLSLAVLERRVHNKVLPVDEVAIQIELPDECIEKSALLEANWQANEPYTQSFGTEWLLSSRSLCLAVPSVLVPELNYLINPLHLDIDRIKIRAIVPYRYDKRLFEY